MATKSTKRHKSRKVNQTKRPPPFRYGAKGWEIFCTCGEFRGVVRGYVEMGFVVAGGRVLGGGFAHVVARADDGALEGIDFFD